MTVTITTGERSGRSQPDGVEQVPDRPRGGRGVDREPRVRVHGHVVIHGWKTSLPLTASDAAGLSAADREDDRLLRDVAFLAQGDDTSFSVTEESL